VKLLARFARKVVVNYDGDSAGVQAAKRAIETLLAEDLEVKVLVLPDNSDPDEFIRNKGVTEYQRRRGEAQPHIQFVIDQAVRDRNLHRPADKAAAVEEVLPFVRAVRSRIQKREYFDIAMDALRMQPEQRREIWQRVRLGASAESATVQGTVTRSVATKPTVAEEKLLELLLADEDLRRAILPQLEVADYEGLPTATIFAALLELERDGLPVNFDSLSARVEADPVAAEMLPRLLISDATESVTAERLPATAASCLNALRLMTVDRRINELSAELAEAERAGDSEKSGRVAVAHLELTRRRAALLPMADAASNNL
jgi:DNA primase